MGVNMEPKPEQQLVHLQLDTVPPQQKLQAKLEVTAVQDTLRSVAPSAAPHAHAYSTLTAAKWQGVVPARALDKDLSGADFSTLVALQLGVDLQEEATSCQFCGTVCDVKGIHCLPCMSGVDTVAVDNELRGETFAWCQRGRLQPTLEKGDLLSEIGLPDGRRRLADVLICRKAAFLTGLPGQDSAVRRGEVPLDCATVNVQGQGRHEDTGQYPLDAAISYSRGKASHFQTRSQCEQSGPASGGRNHRQRCGPNGASTTGASTCKSRV